ncbi:hypothetical protein [Methylobacillus methanolivorans]
MHQQAILVTANPKLGSAGTPVIIGDIEKHFATTATANAGIEYKCADPKCGVPVIAVITKLTTATRKTSPSSYFRANGSKPHANGCTREPSPSVPTTASHGGPVNPASPNRTNAPAVWVDPLSQAGGTSGVGGSATGTPSSGSRSTRGTKGLGTSQGRSQMVESFAKKWLAMNAQIQRSSPLTAPWNPQGTYYTAFHAFAYHRAADVSSTGQKIYVGILKQAVKTTSGYIISLSEVNSSGEALEMFVPSSALLFGISGTTLNSRLGGLVGTTKTTQVFALGTFSRINSETLSLTVTHPHYIYIP